MPFSLIIYSSIKAAFNNHKTQGNNKLRRDQFAKNAPGQLKQAAVGFLTFEPDPLPPRLSLDMDMIRQITDAERALGELAGLGRMLPNPHLLIGPFLRREAVLSSRIEGTVTQLEELLLFEVQPEEMERPADVQEVANYVQALEFGLHRLKNLPLCMRLLGEIHERLLAGVRGADKTPGQIRACPVMIGRKGQDFEEARFVPADHLALPGLLKDFEAFLNNSGNLPLTVQIALAHYQFETIHPFKDGNGRIGRLLITLLLCERRCLPQPLLYLSAFFERHDEEYRDHLLSVSQKATWNDWLRFVAQGVAEQSRDAIERAKQLLDLWQGYRGKMQELAMSTTVLRLIDELFSSPIITISHAQKILQVSFPTAQASIQKLEKAGVLRETTKKQRNRVYVAPAILKLLDEKTNIPIK
jgi:Fic family protein